jgi:X-Pro dipeptidyl-peptidase
MRPLLAIALVLPLALRQDAPVPQPRFADGRAQPVYSATDIVRQNVWVEVAGLDSDRDGLNDRIRVEIHRPAATDRGVKLPIVLNASPYAGGMMPYPRHDLNVDLFVPGRTPRAPTPPETPPPATVKYDGTEAPVRAMRASGYEAYFLPRGFIFAYADSLGTGSSTGCPTIGGPEENLAMKAVIDWFNGRARGFDESGRPVAASWTTGATAMIGVSYEGTLPINAAVTGVEGLKAIVPIAGVSSYYDHRRSFGAVINSYPVQGTDADTLFTNILSRKHSEVCAYMHDRILAGEDRETGDYNAFWDARNYVKDAGRIKAAVLIEQGLNDFNVKPRNAARFWAALQEAHVPSKIWWTQGPHGDRANTANQQAWQDTLNRFWSHFLFGIDNGVMDEPLALVERENHEWVPYATWPIPGSAAVRMNLVAAAGAQPGQLTAASARSASSEESFTDDANVSADDLAAAPDSAHRLLYLTPPLASSVHLSGVPSVSLRLTFDAPAAIVSAMIVDYRASDKPFIVTRGWADPQNRDALDRTTPVVPGTPYAIRFELQPHDYVFAAGSRIGLMILASDQLFTLHPPAGRRVTINTGESFATIPVVGGQSSVAAAVRR